MTTMSKAHWTIGVMVLACLVFLCAPAFTWAQDSDMDGLYNQDEEAGFDLYPGYDLWNGVTWITPDQATGTGIPIPACTDTNATNCLSVSKPDLFVIWYAAPEPESNIDLEKCDLFALGTKSTSAGGLGFNIWVLRKNGGDIPGDRIFTPASAQKAIALVESTETAVNVTGWSQYATVMEEGKGIAVIYSQKIVNDINPAAESSTGLDGQALQCLHFQNTAIHEILHVAWVLENDLKNVYSHHITRGEYIMQPAIVYTEKKGLITYYIPEKASSATQQTWSFGLDPR